MIQYTFYKIVQPAIDSVDKSATKMDLTTSSAIIQGMTDEVEHLVADPFLVTDFYFSIL